MFANMKPIILNPTTVSNTSPITLIKESEAKSKNQINTMTLQKQTSLDSSNNNTIKKTTRITPQSANYSSRISWDSNGRRVVAQKAGTPTTTIRTILSLSKNSNSNNKSDEDSADSNSALNMNLSETATSQQLNHSNIEAADKENNNTVSQLGNLQLTSCNSANNSLTINASQRQQNISISTLSPITNFTNHTNNSSFSSHTHFTKSSGLNLDADENTTNV